MLKRLSMLLVLGVAVYSAATTAQAEVSQRDQQRAAQRAYEESAKDYNDAARGFEKFRDAAERLRDGAIEVERRLLERSK
jgi:hypothetical protein